MVGFALAVNVSVCLVPMGCSVGLIGLIPLLFGQTIVIVRLVKTQQRIQTHRMELQTVRRRAKDSAVSIKRRRIARELHNMHVRLVTEILRSGPHRNDFVQAIKEETERYERLACFRVHLDLNEKVWLSERMAEHCLPIVKECLLNAAKHAEADHVWIWMNQTDSAIRIEVFDDGKGFDRSDIGKKVSHYGLIGMKKQVRMIGGALEISSSEDGTVVRVDIPLVHGER